jgi:hypothetical protein
MWSARKLADSAYTVLFRELVGLYKLLKCSQNRYSRLLENLVLFFMLI